MKRKILAGIIAAVVVVGVILVAVNTGSNNNNKKDTEDTTVASTNENQSDNAPDNTTEKPDSNDAKSPANDTTNENNNNNTEESEDIDAAAKADIAKTKDDAVKKLLDYYLGEDDAYVQNTIKVKVTNNSDKTVTVSKTDDESNTYYSDFAPFSDNSEEGLIISIDSYNENEKSYTYTLKDFAAVKSGDTTSTLDTGTIPEEGNVNSNTVGK